MRRLCLATVSLLLLSTLAARGAAPTVEPTEQLTLADVQTIIAQAVTKAVKEDPSAIIAVVDREGFVLGVWDVASRTGGKGDLLIEGGLSPVGVAIREAGTASYLSSDGEAFTTRTAQFIIQQNFPPGIRNTGNGPLVGVEFSNMPYSDVNRFRRLDAGPNGEVPGKPGNGFILDGKGNVATLGTGIPDTRLSGRQSSVPLYKNNILVGGIGVYGGAADSLQGILATELSNTVPAGNDDEGVALAGQIGYKPPAEIKATNVTINGLRVPYVNASVHRNRDLIPFASLPGKPVLGYSLHAAPPLYPYPTEYLGGQQIEFRFPIRADQGPETINGQPRLTADEITAIIDRASDRARTTRAGIRNPVGLPMECWITVVGNPNADNTPAPILAIARTPGATFFSFDVALQKARTALFFSSNTMAFSSRTVGFLAQNFYPPGLEGRQPGPLGPEVPTLKKSGALKDNNQLGQQVTDSFNAFFGPQPVLLPVAPAGVTPDSMRFAAGPPNPNLPNGITVFPGGFPLYRNGQLIGAVGISGDGVDQDDIVGASASGTGFDAPGKIRADTFTYDGARLPYAKFPRNPER